MAHNGRMIGVIGGSGFYTFFGSDARSVNLDTPYGEPSAPITVGRVGLHEVAFLPRHGLSHEFSPHTVPYRANMWALRALGVRRVFGPCAVGSLTHELGPGTIVVPDQLVDRTRGRGDTYFDSGGIHVGFADPYGPTMRAMLQLVYGVLPAMRARRWGRIVYIGSSALKTPIPNLALSNGFRAGVLGVLKSLSFGVAADNVTVNTVAPGRIETERARQIYADPAVRAKQVASIPAGRFGDPDEFGPVVAFLASDQARYITGTTIAVDGGLSPTLT